MTAWNRRPDYWTPMDLLTAECKLMEVKIYFASAVALHLLHLLKSCTSRLHLLNVLCASAAASLGCICRCSSWLHLQLHVLAASAAARIGCICSCMSWLHLQLHVLSASAAACLGCICSCTSWLHLQLLVLVASAAPRLVCICSCTS